ncbi:glycoside hydrolase family 127 protein, partial [Fulvivirga kasyanovii]|nr:glycoside hydrolase family 127 protein [Fulvivirga kasyanovii]
MKKVLFCFGFVWAMLFSQCREPERSIQGRAAEPGDEQHSGYLLQPVDIRHVKLEDDFWLPVIQKVQGKTIEYAINKCREEGRFDNFLIAGGRMDGEVKGAMPFDDTDVYKII